MKKYEYRTILVSGKSAFQRTIDVSKFTKELNKLGAEGWELVTSKSAQPEWGSYMGILFVFKRPIHVPTTNRKLVRLDDDWY